MKKFLILLSVFYIGCESPVSNEIVEHEFRVFSETLYKDGNSYYHMTLNPNINQTFSTLTAYTSSESIQKVGWYTEESWTYTHFNGEDFEVPLVNTLILLCSGATITYSHHAITAGNKKEAVFGLVLTIVLAFIFTGFQAFEYVSASFSISDGIFGSTFFMATGFHGFHVFVGTLFLSVCLVRMNYNHFSNEHHFGFEAAAFY